MRRITTVMTVAALAAALGACANDQTNFLTTAALSPAVAPSAAVTPTAESNSYPVDPSCAPLAAKIDKLRGDQSVTKLEQASTGKTKTVAIKRQSLATQTELNKANFEFQSKCMGPGQRPVTAQTSPATSAPTTVAAATAAKARKP